MTGGTILGDGAALDKRRGVKDGVLLEIQFAGLPVHWDSSGRILLDWPWAAGEVCSHVGFPILFGEDEILDELVGIFSE